MVIVSHIGGRSQTFNDVSTVLHRPAIYNLTGPLPAILMTRTEYPGF